MFLLKLRVFQFLISPLPIFQHTQQRKKNLWRFFFVSIVFVCSDLIALIIVVFQLPFQLHFERRLYLLAIFKKKKKKWKDNIASNSGQEDNNSKTSALLFFSRMSKVSPFF